MYKGSSYPPSKWEGPTYVGIFPVLTGHCPMCQNCSVSSSCQSCPTCATCPTCPTCPTCAAAPPANATITSNIYFVILSRRKYDRYITIVLLT